MTTAHWPQPLEPVLDLVAHHMIGLHFDVLFSDTEMGRMALCCHFSLDVLCAEAHNATTWHAEVEPCMSPNWQGDRIVRQCV